MAPSTGVVDLKGLDDVQAASTHAGPVGHQPYSWNFHSNFGQLACPGPCLAGSWRLEFYASSSGGLGNLCKTRTQRAVCNLVTIRVRQQTAAWPGYAAILAAVWETGQVLQRLCKLHEPEHQTGLQQQ